MPRRKDAINLGLQFTPEQHAALTKAAILAGLPLATYVRKVLAANVPGFADTLQQRKRLNKKPTD